MNMNISFKMITSYYELICGCHSGKEVRPKLEPATPVVTHLHKK